MKPTILYSIAALAVVALLAACSQDDDLGTGDSGSVAPLQITSAGIGAPQAQTRAATTAKLTTGSIGIFRTQGTGYKEELKNRKYTNSTAKGWQPAAAADTVFLFWNAADVHAYYPYDAAYTDKAAVPLTSGTYTGTPDDLTKHDPHDICYGSKTGMRATAATADLTLKHAMSLLRLNFSRLNYESSKCIITSIKITNSKLAATAKLNLTNGALTGVAAVTAPIDYTGSAVTVPATGSISKDAFLLIPASLSGSSTVFTFVVDGKTMKATVPAATFGALQAGKIHQLDFKIHAASVVLSDVNIIDWTDKWASGSEPDEKTPIAANDYIEIAGTRWALSNLEYHTTHSNYGFAKQPSDAGTSLEWNALTTDAGTGNAGAWNNDNDPCSRIEPKGTWMTPTETMYTSLYATARVSGTLNGTAGTWYGTGNAATAAANPLSYLFIPAQAGTSYWTQTKSGASPRATAPAGGTFADQAATTASPIRCVKAPGIKVPIDQITLTANGCTDADKIVLSKLRWAAGNLKSKGSEDYDWAPTQEEYGYYYPYMSTYKADEYTGGENIDPCTKLKPGVYGTGWRTPTLDEMKSLSRCTDVVWITSGTRGMWFMAPAPDGLFLPGAGYRRDSEPNGTGSGTVANKYPNYFGFYLSSTKTDDDGKPVCLRINYHPAAVTAPIELKDAASVRCVRD